MPRWDIRAWQHTAGAKQMGCCHWQCRGSDGIGRMVCDWRANVLLLTSVELHCYVRQVDSSVLRLHCRPQAIVQSCKALAKTNALPSLTATDRWFGATHASRADSLHLPPRRVVLYSVQPGLIGVSLGSSISTMMSAPSLPVVSQRQGDSHALTAVSVVYQQTLPY